MSERGDELETAKAVIRALLIAVKRQLTVRSLLLAFKDSEGHELPYTRFGFGDPLSFLRSIPDTVQLSQIGSVTYVSAIVTEEVEHLQSLVRGQKESYCRPLRCPSKYSVALEQLKTNLRVLLADHITNGINAHELQDRYTKRFGHHINYAFLGYSTFEEFLIDMPDVMCPVRNSTGAVKVFLSKRSIAVPLLLSEKQLPTFTGHHATKKQPLSTQLPAKKVLKPLQELVRTANSWLPLHADMEPRMLDSYQSNSTGQSLCSDMHPTGVELQRLESLQSRPTERSLQHDTQPAGMAPQILESGRSRPAGHSFHSDIQPAVAVPLLLSEKRLPTFTAHHATKKQPLSTQLPAKKVLKPLQELVRTANSWLPLHADMEPRMLDSYESNSTGQSLCSDMHPTGVEPQRLESLQRRPTERSLQHDTQPAGMAPQILELGRSRPAVAVPLLLSEKRLPTFTAHHATKKQPLSTQLPAKKVLKPLQELVRTANSWLPLHADMEPRMLDSYESNSTGQSLCSDMHPTGVEPQRLESLQRRPTERSLQHDTQPAGMAPQILELGRSRPAVAVPLLLSEKRLPTFTAHHATKKQPLSTQLPAKKVLKPLQELVRTANSWLPLHADMEPRMLDSYESNSTGQSLCSDMHPTGVEPQRLESLQSRPTERSLQHDTQPAVAVPLLLSEKRLPTFTAHHATKKQPLSTQLPAKKVLKPLQELVRTANSWLPLHADMEPRMLDSYESNSTGQSLCSDMHPTGVEPQRLESLQSRPTERSLQHDTQPAVAVPLLLSEKRLPTFTAHHATKKQPLSTQLPAKKVLKPLQELVRTANSWLPLHADMEPRMLDSYQSNSTGQSLCSDMHPTGVEPQRLESLQRRPTERSLQHDTQPAGMAPQILESGRSRPAGHAFHSDIQPAGMKPPMPESCQTEPTEPSVHAGIQPRRTHRQKNEPFQSRLSPLPELPLECEEAPPCPTKFDSDMLWRRITITRSDPDRWEALCVMNPQLETNIQMVAGQHPEGVRLSWFSEVYKEVIGTELCPGDYGYNNIRDLIIDFRHVVSMRPIPDGDMMISLHTVPNLALWIWA
ncbi:uncharacterized protein LOC119436834 [Dermacentor silvarum]|uniref:uncharacterized protein LOC119436834 n=1 Tax=Dermacentor silvarum TaxID=543639 RepID=UPI0021013B2A|nr:uncharacterized protein LOC119436834 [Dermacentor silvarum]